MEKELERPLHWVICQFHGNELPFRHLFEMLDCKTAGPTPYCGTIGKSLASCENLPIIKFDAVETPNIPIVNPTDFSSDQKYLSDIWNAVKTGKCSPKLA